ncbi:MULTISPECIES: 2-phosphosulfolactate phosphatase [unclassified Microbacterium]|uniref:2-phosphosulfolactate phosphatase n=1 Tax=unclassified Microbacterium TaxID=2609290 RepID=UPI000CFDEFAA|nr:MULTISPECIES: 2-phosphosulfolactate phosphatase [unclassified Microbacterium]PQZ55104.1 phosphosulfolactate phosphohydrolase [Microbacterium sp. MYb43]PQZ81452.1 phosphosulfolactate phosphohydrolase [Microbacterium sp. MYb40]PRB21434.1 phosphosulfolactate phosphohydrolase [Microbacterium sp. MYb54]PRB29999.1 phosphosulfolactate phosphohydrolase [Microbacterium sp. MYb50]PRB67843.1 phosphosulfolactate phosphohydrolase [Microbacterium sp. MYb24]
MPSPFDQSTYQVRLDWGTAGLARLAPVDVVVVVDVLRFSSTVIDATASGVEVVLSEAETWSRNGAAVAAAASSGAIVLVGGLRNASAVARVVQTIQERRQARTAVAVIAAGELDDAGVLRFAVEDQLGAGAIVSALSDRGIDHTAPDAAVAAEGFRALRSALRHMVGASGSGRELAEGVAATAGIEAAGLVPTEVKDAAAVDAVDVVPVLRDGSFVRFD